MEGKGYQADFMTGIAWGQYFDYFLGKWDGQNHLGLEQVTINGDTIFHGHNMPYYGFNWRPQDASPENTYLSNKLKYYLFYNAIQQVSAYAKQYGKTTGKTTKVYIPRILWLTILHGKLLARKQALHRCRELMVI